MFIFLGKGDYNALEDGDDDMKEQYDHDWKILVLIIWSF